MSAPELLPCPWCGPMNGHYGFTIGRFGTRLTCFCCASHGPRAVTREEAITAWNKRATTPLSAALAVPEVAALVEALPRWIDAMGDWDKGGEATMEEMQEMLAALKP